MRVRRATEAAAVLHPPASAIGLIVRVGLALDPVLFLQAPLGVLETFATRAGDRAFLLGTALFKALLGFAQPAAPALGGRELRRYFIAALLAVALVLSAIAGVGL